MRTECFELRAIGALKSITPINSKVNKNLNIHKSEAHNIRLSDKQILIDIYRISTHWILHILRNYETILKLLKYRILDYSRLTTRTFC